MVIPGDFSTIETLINRLLVYLLICVFIYLYVGTVYYYAPCDSCVEYPSVKWSKIKKLCPVNNLLYNSLLSKAPSIVLCSRIVNRTVMKCSKLHFLVFELISSWSSTIQEWFRPTYFPKGVHDGMGSQGHLLDLVSLCSRPFESPGWLVVIRVSFIRFEAGSAIFLIRRVGFVVILFCFTLFEAGLVTRFVGMVRRDSVLFHSIRSRFNETFDPPGCFVVIWIISVWSKPV